MENETLDRQNTGSSANVCQRKEIGLPLTALLFSLSPLLIIALAGFGLGTPFILLLAIATPIAAIVMGIVALCRGKRRIGTAGVILSITAIALPVVVVVFIIVLFIGISSMDISFM